MNPYRDSWYGWLLCVVGIHKWCVPKDPYIQPFCYRCGKRQPVHKAKRSLNQKKG